MFRPDVLPLQASLLSLAEKEQAQLPPTLRIEVQAVKTALRQAVQQDDYFTLEAALEALFPPVWALRMQVIPLLAQMNIAEALGKIETDFALIAQNTPALRASVDALQFGLHLMAGVISALTADQGGIETLLPPQPTSDFPTYEEAVRQLSALQPNLQHLLHGSLKMELLLFAVELVAHEDISLEFGMLHEIKYQSQMAVEEYAVALEVPASEMPWYTPPQNELQQILLSGPVLTVEELQHVYDKKDHLNSWK